MCVDWGESHHAIEHYEKGRELLLVSCRTVDDPLGLFIQPCESILIPLKLDYSNFKKLLMMSFIGNNLQFKLIYSVKSMK